MKDKGLDYLEKQVTAYVHFLRVQLVGTKFNIQKTANKHGIMSPEMNLEIQKYFNHNQQQQAELEILEWILTEIHNARQK